MSKENKLIENGKFREVFDAKSKKIFFYFFPKIVVGIVQRFLLWVCLCRWLRMTFLRRSSFFLIDRSVCGTLCNARDSARTASNSAA